jgi:hypothetical protein
MTGTLRAAPSASRAHLFRLIAALMGPVSALATLAVFFSARAWPLKGTALYLMAGAPTLPLLVSMVCMGLYLRNEPDEFQRASVVEAMMWATALLLTVGTAGGFLALFAGAGVSPLLLALCYPAWTSAYGVARGLVWLRYR